MNAIQLLRDQLKSAHETQEQTVADASHEVLHFADTGKAMPAGAAYAHSVLAEDMIVSDMLAHKPSLIAGGAETGLSEPLPSQQEWDKHEQWYKTVKVDLPKLQQFAKKVYQATDDYVAGLTESDLDTEMDIPGMGTFTLAWVLNNFVILHIANLTGEISAAKGIQGLKGYPF